MSYDGVALQAVPAVDLKASHLNGKGRPVTIRHVYGGAAWHNVQFIRGEPGLAATRSSIVGWLCIRR